MPDMDFSDFFKFSFSWISKDWLKWIASYWIIQLVFNFGILFLISAFFSSLSSSGLLLALLNPSVLTNQWIGKILQFAVVFIAWLLLYSFILLVFQILCFLQILRKNNLPARSFSLKLVVRYILVCILELVCVLFYPLDKKIRILQWLSLLLLIASPFIHTVNSLFIVLMGIPLVFYLIIVLHNSFRLLPLAPVFLSTENAGIRSSFRKAWDLTEGKVFETFALFFILFIVTLIAQGLLTVLLSFAVDPFFQSVLSFLPKQFIQESNFAHVFASALFFFSTLFGIVFFYKHLLESKASNSLPQDSGKI